MDMRMYLASISTQFSGIPILKHQIHQREIMFPQIITCLKYSHTDLHTVLDVAIILVVADIDVGLNKAQDLLQHTTISHTLRDTIHIQGTQASI